MAYPKNKLAHPVGHPGKIPVKKHHEGIYTVELEKAPEYRGRYRD
jgi:hypothetical protein